MKTIVIEDVEIKYTHEDTGKPKVVFIHGFDSSMEFMFNLRSLQRDYDIIALDLPSHGKSGSIKVPTVEIYAHFVKELLERLDLKDVTLLGHSMGGGVSAFAASSPRVKKAILLNSLNPYTYEEALRSFNAADLARGAIEEIMNRDEKSNIFLKFIINYKSRDMFIINKQFASKKWQGQELYFAFKDNRDKLFLIGSAKDRIIAPSSVIRTSRALNIKMMMLDDAKHSPLKVKAKKINDIINTLIKEMYAAA